MKLSVALWVAVDSLAVYRLTVLVTRDRILDRPRLALRRWEGLFDFVTCPWCTSIWLAGAVVGLTRFVASAWAYVALLLAFSAVAGVLSELVH